MANIVGVDVDVLGSYAVPVGPTINIYVHYLHVMS